MPKALSAHAHSKIVKRSVSPYSKILKRSESPYSKPISTDGPPQQPHDVTQRPSKTKRLDVAAVFALLQEISSEKNDKIIEHLRQQPWHLIDAIPKEIVDLGLNVPTLIPADECWTPAQPTDEQLFAACIDQHFAHPDDISIESAGARTSPPTLGTLLHQLKNPNPSSPLIGHNLALASVPTATIPARIRSTFTVQPGLNADFEPASNITPAYSFVDVHNDQGTNGLSITAPPCTKVWFLWPPTPRNLAAYERAYPAHPARVLRARFDHGVLALVDAAHGIFLPSGWLHATLTLTGGFLSGVTFAAAETVATASACAAAELKRQPAAFDAVGVLYRNALRTALLAPAPGPPTAVLRAAVEGWLPVARLVEALPALKKSPSTGPKRRLARELQAVWLEFFERAEQARGAGGGSGADGGGGGALLLPTTCPCGAQRKGELFKRHFWEKHLKFLDPRSPDPHVVAPATASAGASTSASGQAAKR